MLCEPAGLCRLASLEEARSIFRSGEVMVAHAVFVGGRLTVAPAKPLYDVLELFAFVRPAQPCVPSAQGLARALGIASPATLEDAARALHDAAAVLLSEISASPEAAKTGLRPLAQTLATAGWRWAKPILQSIGEGERPASPVAGFDVWRALPVWEDEAPPAPASSLPVSLDEAAKRLAQLVGTAGEARPEQRAYTDAASYAFAPRERVGVPKIALVEAGTGIGKTLGYLAPASLWSEKNGPGLWISTYTRNLQRQIVQEIARLYPDPKEREEKTVVRKGRENYLCLLNFEEAIKRTTLAPGQRTVALALIARWVAATADGDTSGVGFPAFLTASLPLREITDRRGECIYAACPHYRTCFIERVVRRARNTPIVVANHALVIAQAAQDWPSVDETTDTQAERRVRYVFDEGHHLFDAADSGFSASMSGAEMAELRRWIRGPEGRARSRMRGLEERLKDLVEDHEDAHRMLDEAVLAAGALAGEGASSRLSSPRGAGEIFLAAAYGHVRARSDDHDGFYSLEADTQPAGEQIIDAAKHLRLAVKRLAAPLMRIGEVSAQAVERQGERIGTVPARADRSGGARIGTARAHSVAGLDGDAGERWKPARSTTSSPTGSRSSAKTAAISMSASSGIGSIPPFRWRAKCWRTRTARSSPRPRCAMLCRRRKRLGKRRSAHRCAASARAAQARQFRLAVFLCRASAHIRREGRARGATLDALAAAYRELFLASGGGALGLFTAVRALRAVESRIASAARRCGPHALCPACRPARHRRAGRSVPRRGEFLPARHRCVARRRRRAGPLACGWWCSTRCPGPSRPSCTRRAAPRFGKGYDDLLTRLRLKQAFGRLIRGAEDKGCFVILEGATPSRLLCALSRPKRPSGAAGLAEAIGEIRGFLGRDHGDRSSGCDAYTAVP